MSDPARLAREYRLAAMVAADMGDENAARLAEAQATIVRLRSEVERLQRYEAMWEDCRRHRDQAEKRARRLQEIVTQVADLVDPMAEDEL